MISEDTKWSSVGVRQYLKKKMRALGKKDENWNDLLERLIFVEGGR